MSVARGETIAAVTNATLLGAAEPVDLHLADGRIAEVSPAGSTAATGPALDAGGRTVLPGFWDHHVHTVQAALWAERTNLLGAASAAEAARAMAASPALGDGRKVGMGMRDALWPDEPTFELLDAATGEVPTYILNSDLHSMWINSAAARREGLPEGLGPILREMDCFRVSGVINAVDDARSDTLMAQLGRQAASRGLVGIVDLQWTWTEPMWTRRIANGFDWLRVDIDFYPEHLPRAIAEGMRSGDVARGAADSLAVFHALKLVTDGSIGTRTAACTHHYADDHGNFGAITIEADAVTDYLRQATAAGIRVAVHAIGDLANANALDAFEATGAAGTIEHAQLVQPSDLARMARLGVAASIQPEHALDDRDIVDRVWADQTAIAYPGRSLQRAGVVMQLGSDAPVAPLDPWMAIASAVYRQNSERAAWRSAEAIDLETAIAASTHAGSGPNAQRIAAGQVADLVICDSDPATAAPLELRTMPVGATLLGGRITHLG
ncbi:metal-dependent hydrolase [Microbacterium paludicola]|uniref:Metal-dependent hydrolase n=1 Tax=Microbacterium paludicola TaxID=300019 RepID=A0A4Y9FUC7_9MICO|nr:amidohydrolase family protein [Microbacterium paludicola]MBF0817188.1 amidohydrolase family protein [Microbacterium paludicola]TFU32115.1 metal-dependent hydrolase [Microbacterium paludicola]